MSAGVLQPSTIKANSPQKRSNQNNPFDWRRRQVIGREKKSLSSRRRSLMFPIVLCRAVGPVCTVQVLGRGVMGSRLKYFQPNKREGRLDDISGATGANGL